MLKGAQAEEVTFVFVAEQTSATINEALEALANDTGTKIVILSGALNQTKATAKTDVAAFRTDRAIYVYPPVQIQISEANSGAGGLVTVSLNSWLAGVLARIAPGRNPAGPGESNLHNKLLSEIRAMSDQTLERNDYEDFRRLGICALNIGPGGFQFRSGVTTSLTAGLANIARRTFADFIQNSISNFLQQYQNFVISDDTKMLIKSGIEGFMRTQQSLGIVPRDRDMPPGLLPFLVDLDSPNTAETQAQGILFIDLSVRNFPTADFIVLRSTIGEGVAITTQLIPVAA
jgi:phage tail sheath protein FI